MRRIVVLWMMVSLSALAQDDDPFFPKPSYFKKHFASAHTAVELQPPVRLADYVIDGKFELSLKAFLNLTMANNPDISIQRLSVEFNRDAITRALGIFDPLATASFNATRTLTGTTSAIQGASTLNTLSQPLSLGFQQTLATGAFYNIGFSSIKISDNSSFATLNPSFTTGVNFSVTQPLLRGRGSFITKLPITIAQSQLRVANLNFENQLIQLISTAELAYWAVVEAHENVRVAQESLKLADATLKRAQRELELGASSPLDIFQPQQSFANAQLTVTQAEYAVTQAEDAMRRQMGADRDPNYRTMPIVLTEPVMPLISPGAIDKEKMVSLALDRRPDLKSARQALDVDDLNIRLNNDAMRPNLSFTAQYGSSGIGGNLYDRTDVFGGTGQVVSVIPGGIGNALSQLFGFSLPTYGGALTLQLPIKNHAAAANLADSMVSKKMDALRLQSAEQNVRLQVLTAVNNVENSKASVELAKVALGFAQKRADGDQKKYDLGAEVIFFVLQAQADLTTAESALVRETLNLRRNQLALWQQVRTLLEERDIAVQ